MKKIFKFLNVALKMTLAMLASWSTAQIVIPLAAAERGYTGAYGGEWYLIIAVFVGTYYLFSKLNKEVYRQ